MKAKADTQQSLDFIEVGMGRYGVASMPWKRGIFPASCHRPEESEELGTYGNKIVVVFPSVPRSAYLTWVMLDCNQGMVAEAILRVVEIGEYFCDNEEYGGKYVWEDYNVQYCLSLDDILEAGVSIHYISPYVLPFAEVQETLNIH